MTLQKLTMHDKRCSCLAALRSQKAWHKQNLVACVPTSRTLINSLNADCPLSVQYCMSEQVTVHFSIYNLLVAYIFTSLSAARSGANLVSCVHACNVTATLAACSQQTHEREAAVESFRQSAQLAQATPKSCHHSSCRSADQERHRLFQSSS